MPGEVRWEEETTHQGEKQGGQAQSFWSVASERVASVFEDMANRESGDISYIKSFLEKILDPDKRTSKRKSTKLNKPKDTSKEKEKGKEERRSQRLDESFSTTSLSSNETKHNENDESEDEESKRDERRKESSSDETDEERILARLPKGIPRMSESDWNFPTERLKIEKVIATPGQFSKIQLARYEGRKVCVKQVQVQDEVYAVMEITLLKYLEHEHVLGFLGAAREMVDGEPCIWAVTEFMEGGSVSDALKADLGRDKKKKPLLFDFKKRVRVALHAAQALEYVHSQGVIHRDVKSDNLLLTGRGDDLVCKLADFGFARGLFGKHELQQGADMTQGTLRRGRHHRAQTICGTDETMAPEMMLHSGDSPYTTAVDVFSFGCVLLELCSGQTLSKDFLPRLPQNNFAFDEEEVRSSAMASCPQSLLELAVHCIQPEPEDRLTPTECKEWLEELLADLDSGQVEYVGASRSNSGFLETVAIQDKVTSSPPPPKSCCLIM